MKGASYDAAEARHLCEVRAAYAVRRQVWARLFNGQPSVPRRATRHHSRLSPLGVMMRFVMLVALAPYGACMPRLFSPFACGQALADVGVRQENLVSALVTELTRNEKRVHVDFASKLKVRSRVGLHVGAVVRMYGAALAGHFFQVLAVWLPACRGSRR